jgi:methionine biosynthesis protein MetW
MNPRDPRLRRQAAKVRADLLLIADMIAPGTRVLDVGCGNGVLLDYLQHFKQVTGRGMELSQEGVNACVAQGLSVIQGDADTDLADYPSGAFDYAILSQTLQATHDPRHVLEQLVRIGARAVVSFPNFGNWRLRLSLLFKGRMPVTDALPLAWHETPNIHLCTTRDFTALCSELGIHIERALALDADGRTQSARPPRLANLLGQHAMFLLRKD